MVINDNIHPLAIPPELTKKGQVRMNWWPECIEKALISHTSVLYAYILQIYILQIFVTLKWNIPAEFSKDWSMGTTCAIRPLRKVSEAIAARNQQLPGKKKKKKSVFSKELLYSLNSHLSKVVIVVVVFSCKPEIISYPHRPDHSQSGKLLSQWKQASHCCFVPSGFPEQCNNRNKSNVDKHVKTNT